MSLGHHLLVYPFTLLLVVLPRGSEAIFRMVIGAGSQLPRLSGAIRPAYSSSSMPLKMVVREIITGGRRRCQAKAI